MAQLIPLPLTVSCFSKIQIGFTFLTPAHLGIIVPDKEPLNGCVCVYPARVMSCVRVYEGCMTDEVDDADNSTTTSPSNLQTSSPATNNRESTLALSDRWHTCDFIIARFCRTTLSRVRLRSCTLRLCRVIAKFHYTDPTGPARTQRSFAAKKVRAGPVGSV